MSQLVLLTSSRPWSVQLSSAVPHAVLSPIILIWQMLNLHLFELVVIQLYM